MERSFETPGQVAVSLQLGSGDIVVRASETGRSVARVSGYAAGREPRITCDQTRDGHRIVVETPKRAWGLSFGRGLLVELLVPPGTLLEGTSGSAELRVHGSLGGLSFKTGSGDIRFEDVTGDVRVLCASGDVVGGHVGGQLYFKGASGDMELDSVGGGAYIRTASGDVLIGELKGSTAVTVMSGDVELACVSGGTVHVRSLAGDVRVGIREGLDVWLDLSSIGGDVRSALETGRTAPGGEPTVELTVVTTSGDIDVRRANRVGA